MVIPLKLTIFGGITGFDKSEFIQSFTLKCFERQGLPVDITNDRSQRFIHYIKFEDILLDETDSVDIPGFLARPSFHEKVRSIERTFSRIGSLIEETESEHVFLDIHLSCLYHSQFFPPLNAANLDVLDPSEETEIIVLTLIDDVYNIWNNLKKREEEFPNTSLRIREILSWRSVELLLAESVALNYTTESRQVNNYLFAVRHPFVSLRNLIFSKNPICLYLSFPITNTRNHSERVEDINKFRKHMYKISEELDLVIFDPVTVDELALKFASRKDNIYILNKEHRWPLETELLVKDPDWPIEIPQNEVDEALPDIINQIKPRDFKLIDSSVFTTAYRTNYGGPSEGVREEIRYTISRGKKSYVFDPVEDSPNKTPHPFDHDEIGFRDLDEYYQNICKGIDFFRKRREKRD